jgi:hypothetical protein
MVDANGIRGSKSIHTLPNFAGTWSGTYVVTGCQSSLEFTTVGFCGLFTEGETLDLTMALSQNRDSASGGFALANVVGSFTTGTVAGSGLAITGTAPNQAFLITVEARFDSSTAGIITGTMDQTWSNGSISGSARLSSTVRRMTRTSGLTTEIRAEGQRFTSLAQMAAALRR